MEETRTEEPATDGSAGSDFQARQEKRLGELIFNYARAREELRGYLVASGANQVRAALEPLNLDSKR